MSSIPMSKVCNRASCAMLLAGLVVLFVGNGMARSDLVASANGNNTTSTTAQTTVGTTPINITAAAVQGTSGIYDLNSVVYLTNNSASTAQTVTAQYTVGGTGVGQTFTLSLAPSATQTVSVPQQLTAQPGTATVGLRIIDTTGGAGNTVTVNASSLAVTGYTTNGGTATVSAPGSSNLASNTTPPTTGSITPVSVASVGVAASQGQIGVNSALVINNSSGAGQSVSVTYTVNGVASGATYSLTLPGNNGSTLVALPSVLSVAAGSTNTIGIKVTDSGGAGITIGAGSTISATSYKTSGGANSATTATAANQQLGNHSLSFFGVLTPISVNVPTASTNGVGFYDVNASIMLSAGQTTASTFTAQYMENGVTPLGPVFTITLPGNPLGGPGAVATFSLPEQFSAAQLTPGTALSVLLTSTSSSTFNVDADTISLVAHNLVPGVSTPEPASLSLAAMAAMAFGAAAYKKRKSSKVQV